MAVMSVATIDKPEFINIKPYNPLISECEVKVLYVGENRNKSYITKEVATKMANSLPGNPIVGYFREDVGDFRDHGDMVTIDDQGIHFKCMTRPYGFIAPNAKVWFQKFEEIDDFGNTCIREYLMTTGFLWTGQYPECQVAASEGGRPHSMELDEDTLDGKWAKNRKSNMDFFIINDAIFSKLCILGEDVEPCFEGSMVSAPKLSTTFSKVDDGFKHTLFSMMQELKDALKGEQEMFEINDKDEELLVQTSFASDKKKEEEDKEEKAAPSEDKKAEEKEDSKAPAKEEDEDKKKKFAKEDEDKKAPSKEDEDDDKEKFAKKEEEKEDKENKSSENKKEEDEDEKKKYSLLEEEYQSLQTQFSELQAKYDELLAFKNQIEDEKKDALINSFYMLSAEDKADVIENKAQYSLDDIEAKLSVICVRKKVNFDLDDNSENEDIIEESPVTTFNLNEQASSVPAWVSALRTTKNSKNN